MFRKKSRRKQHNQKNISLLMVTLAIVIGIIGGLSIDMAQSDTTVKTSQVDKQYGKQIRSSMKSDASVEVTSGNTVQEPEPNLVPKPKPGTKPGSGTRPSPGANSHYEKNPNTSSKDVTNNETDSSGNQANINNAPAVIVNTTGHGSFPQTGEASDQLTTVGLILAVSSLLLVGYSHKKQLL